MHFALCTVTNTETSAFVATVLLSWDMFDLFHVLCKTRTNIWNAVSERYFSATSLASQSEVSAPICCISLPLSCCSHLEHSASLKRFVSLQFLNPKTFGRTPWAEHQPVARPLPIQTQNKHKYPCLEWDSNPPSVRESEDGHLLCKQH
jgi:hypothetical protein